MPRTQINKKENLKIPKISLINFTSGLPNFEKKMFIDSKDIKRILVYSAMKIKANIPPEYSVLNPDTNSLSPSAKSNGVRFVSARVVVNQT